MKFPYTLKQCYNLIKTLCLFFSEKPFYINGAVQLRLASLSDTKCLSSEKPTKTQNVDQCQKEIIDLEIIIKFLSLSGW